LRTIGEVNTHGELSAIASGAITKGSPVVINNDGTVSAVTGTYRNSSFGTAVQIDGTNTSSQVQGCMVGSGKFAVIYKKSTDNEGYAKIGTISGTSITFGSEFNFSSGYQANYINIMYIPSVDRVVFAYQALTGNNLGYIRVATPNTSTNTFDTLGTAVEIGTSSSDADYYFGLAYDIEAARIICVYTDAYYSPNHSYGRPFQIDTSTNALTGGSKAELPKKPATGGTGITAQHPTGVYDTQNNNTVWVYRDDNNAGCFTACQGYVTNLSGAGTMNWSASSTPTGAGRTCTATAGVLDSGVNKGYFAFDGDDYGTMIIGIYSRSPDSSAPLSNSNTNFNLDHDKGGHGGADLDIAYDSTGQKLIVFHHDAKSNKNMYLVNFHRSDSTSANFVRHFKKDIVEYPSTNTSGSSEKCSIFYDSVSDQCILLYRSDKVVNGTAGHYLVAQTYKNPRATSTITTHILNKFTGFAKSGAANGDGVTIQTKGSILRGQSGLVAGTEYYVQSDGSLQTAENWLPVDAGLSSPYPAKPFAGTAISATELRIKG
jgi:hypothetical protein